jgi:hypothetical protein
LANGTCAPTCVNDVPCGACNCRPADPEGIQTCSFLNSCEDSPQLCSSTAECPLNQTCVSYGCGPGGAQQNRCVPVCD